jgi:hypothetical protein
MTVIKQESNSDSDFFDDLEAQISQSTRRSLERLREDNTMRTVEVAGKYVRTRTSNPQTGEHRWTNSIASKDHPEDLNENLQR